MKELVNIRDIKGKVIREGDILSDKVPSKGIVKLLKGRYMVTSDYAGRDILLLDDDCDLLTEDLVLGNKMQVVGNVYEMIKLV